MPNLPKKPEVTLIDGMTIREYRDKQIADSMKLRAEQVKQKKQGEAPQGDIVPPGTELKTPAPKTPEEQLADLKQTQQSLISQYGKETSSVGNLRQSAFDKLFGPESSLQTFYNPNISSIEENIADVTKSLDLLSEDVTERHQDVGLTEAQKRRIEAKERSGLTEQLSDLSSTYEALMSGKSAQMNLSEKEYEAMVADATTAVDSAVEELRLKSGLNDAEIAKIEEQLRLNLETKVAEEKAAKEELTKKKSAVDGIIQEAMNTVYAAGVTPSAAFEKVIKDAQDLATKGYDLGYIQYQIMQAIQQNPQVKKYLTTVNAPKAKSSGGEEEEEDEWDAAMPSSEKGDWQKNLKEFVDKNKKKK